METTKEQILAMSPEEHIDSAIHFAEVTKVTPCHVCHKDAPEGTEICVSCYEEELMNEVDRDAERLISMELGK